MGRPSKYKDEYAEQVLNLSLLGLADDEMCTVFGVSKKTFNTWKQKHPEFLHSLKAGKAPADGKVARQLYTEALNGNVTAMIFWLKNRQSAKWRDKPPEAYDEEAPPINYRIVMVDGRTED